MTHEMEAESYDQTGDQFRESMQPYIANARQRAFDLAMTRLAEGHISTEDAAYRLAEEMADEGLVYRTV